MTTNINTTFHIISDSHGQQLLSTPPAEHIDVAIHCGDLTQESKINDADLKLVIAGNHGFTLDAVAFKKLVANAPQQLEPELVRNGDYGEVRNSLFKTAKDANIILLDEGGILDVTELQQRVGCQHLFLAVARAQPRLHCFGHIHESWGAKFVTWRRNIASGSMPSHFTHIDHSKSRVLGNISRLIFAWQDKDVNCFLADCYFLEQETQTLFVNAALKGSPVLIRYPGLQGFPYLVYRMHTLLELYIGTHWNIRKYV
ncbi:hypothetical protein TSTA_025420 [Talaromyces stipitatus ATCC 10500]|uniref:Calcineurin-like phosphoesterase domain-containing protein n=1 Tax=Talaromyces stipitatus (strain ATCC 10500 / CBS 375.48 / QM 6759 / NRRL 1006) TaxID=441959 RepID=B8M4N0_TALSN|nr:uncharacterized protein TSTA_025420 [Talaromyces stipitatus ATCC 10500]EED19225.1 hypothetical protein TSTA_025420 [Talaromyces stipitatus ATCC 10500]